MTPISSYYLPSVEVYSNRAEFEFRNPDVTLPPFSPIRKPKRWRDTGIKPGTRKMVYTVLALKDDGQPVLGSDGKPFTEPMVLDGVEAAAVNIPTGLANAPGENQPAIPVPLGPLPEGAELVWGLPGAVFVKTREEALSAPVDFTRRDQLAIHAIAKALGV